MALGKEFKKKLTASAVGRRRQIFAECPKFGTRQSSLYREGIRRRLFAECCTRQRLCRVQSCLCRVQQALGKDPTSSSESGQCRFHFGDFGCKLWCGDGRPWPNCHHLGGSSEFDLQTLFSYMRILGCGRYRRQCIFRFKGFRCELDTAPGCSK